jgi:hypothetical protein
MLFLYEISVKLEEGVEVAEMVAVAVLAAVPMSFDRVLCSLQMIS